jgi:hypothetical protein
MAFTFEPSTHSYALNGIVVPSCTRCLDHAGLVSYDMVRREILERKSRIGVLVHQATHYYDEGQLDWNSVHEKIRGYVEGWANFREVTGFVPRRIEQSFCATINGMPVGLTPDREGLFQKREAIVDLKTSSTEQDWWAIQLAGYALGVPDFYGVATSLESSPIALFVRRRRIAVQLFETGKYRKFDYSEREDANVFISALHLTHWKLKQGNKLRMIEEAA